MMKLHSSGRRACAPTLCPSVCSLVGGLGSAATQALSTHPFGMDLFRNPCVVNLRDPWSPISFSGIESVFLFHTAS